MNFLQYSAFSPIELKTIEPIEIARIAANFISDVVSPSKGVLMTYELLDIAAVEKASSETKVFIFIELHHIKYIGNLKKCF
jgi:hypothetical protein